MSIAARDVAKSKAGSPPSSSVTHPKSVLLQRKYETKEYGQEKKRRPLQNNMFSSSRSVEVPPVVHETLRSSGQPLDTSTKLFMESRFGHDFSRVRVHADSQSAESAKAVNALAFTVGYDIVFGDGHYIPGSDKGRELLAHELTHVVQQDSLNGFGGGLMIGSNSDPAEKYASHNAKDVASGRQAKQQYKIASPVLQRQESEKAYNITLQMPPGTPKHWSKISPDEAVKVLRRFTSVVYMHIDNGIEGHKDQKKIRDDQYVVGAISDFFGGFVSMPPLSMWEEPKNYLVMAQRKIEVNDIKTATSLLQNAANATRKCNRELYNYREGTIKGAERTEIGLEVVEVAAAVTISVSTGGTAGMLIGTGYGTAQTIARQGSEVSIGLKDHIDWAGIGFETLLGLATGHLGGKLGNVAVGRIMKNPAAASLGRRAVATIVGDVISGRAIGLMNAAGKTVFESLRGKENVTLEQFMNLMMEQLLDPKGALMDTVMGHVSRKAASRISSAKSASNASQHPPSSPGSHNAPTHLETPAVASKKAVPHEASELKGFSEGYVPSKIQKSAETPKKPSVVEPPSKAHSEPEKIIQKDAPVHVEKHQPSPKKEVSHEPSEHPGNIGSHAQTENPKHLETAKMPPSKKKSNREVKQERKEIVKKRLEAEFEQVKAAANKGNKRAKRILPSWEENIKKGEFGPSLKPKSRKSGMTPEMKKRQKKAEAALAKKKLKIIQKLAKEGDKRAKEILPDWEKSVKKGKLGPAARGKTAYGGTEEWEYATRKSILKEARKPGKSKLPNHIIGWYKQQEKRILNDLHKRAQKGDKIAQNILGDKDRLDDYIVRRMHDPPGYDLGHQLGDKLGENPGDLDFSGGNRSRGSRFRL